MVTSTGKTRKIHVLNLRKSVSYLFYYDIIVNK